MPAVEKARPGSYSDSKTGPSTGRKPLEIDCIGIVLIGASILETDMSVQKGFGLLQHSKDVFG